MAWIKSKLPCPKDNCDSSDAYHVDENGWGKCFSCYANVPPQANNDDGFTAERVIEKRVLPEPVKALNPVKTENVKGSVQYKDITDRKVKEATCKRYGVGYVGEDLVFPYGSEASKVRKRGAKDFTIKGDWKSFDGLFGQDKFSAGGKNVIITEGEIDALSAFQMLDNRWPVVSVKNGAQSALKDCKASFEWLDSFETVFICFDNDTAGQQATKQVAELLARKAKIVRLPHDVKDANDMLKASRSKEFQVALWRGESFVPDGIIAGDSTDLYAELMKPVQGSDVDYPFSGLNDLTYGIRKGELVTLTAGSGLGKSQFLREIIYHIINNTNEKVGLMFMEESVRKTGLSLMSLAANKPLHLPDSEATQEEKDDAYRLTLGTGRVYLFDHFGSSDVDNIVNRVRYMAKAMDCSYVFLDHISIVVSAQSNGDERKAIDEIMTKLRMLVQETGISLFCVSHLKRPDNKGHEEGAATSLAQLRGSGSIAQLSDMVLSLERNGQADDVTERNTTRTRVLKNRFSGTTGPASALLYSHETGRMVEIYEEEEQAL